MNIFWILKIIIFTALFVRAYILSLRYNMHMFQLNGYKNKEHFNRYKKNVRKQWILIFAFALGAIRLAISTAASYIALNFTFTEFMNMPFLDYLSSDGGRKLRVLGIIGNVLEVICLITLLLIIFVYKAHKNLNKKKNLVYTARVKRLIATIIVSDLIIFFLIFIGSLYSSLTGVFLIILSLQPYICIIANIINHPIEEAINNYYINDAKRLLKTLTPDITVIGVTGSYGKTSVKYHLNALLKEKFDVLMTPESYNTPMGIVKTIRGSLKPTHEIFICEMGARHVGDIKEICDIVNPRHGIITSIGPQHLETFFNMENIQNTKFELADALPDSGMLVLNGDCEYIVEHVKKCEKKYKNITYYYTEDNGSAFTAADDNGKSCNEAYDNGTDFNTPGNDKCCNVEGYRAEDIKVSAFGTEFRVVTPDGDECTYTMRLVGMNNVINVLGGVSIAHKLGIPLKDLTVPIRRIEPVPHRMCLIERGNVTIIDDAYNSNPVGSKAGVETLSMFDGVRILITPGMVELGEKEDDYNYKFGTYAAKCCDYILLIGKKHTEPIYKGALSEGFPENRIKVYGQLEDALNFAYSINDDRHKFILLENDLPDNYN